MLPVLIEAQRKAIETGEHREVGSLTGETTAGRDDGAYAGLALRLDWNLTFRYRETLTLAPLRCRNEYGDRI